MLVTCPVCFGDGFHDFADMDAMLGEHLPQEVLALVKRDAGPSWGGRVECPTCNGTGLISEDEAKDIHAASVAAVDQILAMFDHDNKQRRETA